MSDQPAYSTRRTGRAEVDATALVHLRQALVAPIERNTGIRLTLTDLLLRALALALRDARQANCIWQNNNIIRLPNIDVGIVVGLPDGLLIPLIRHADQLDLPALAKQRSNLITAPRLDRLSWRASSP